tara:strand:+ start:1390 stop:1743 length:354 start_codon:yes stop_codon:yes gene_type:complete
MRNWMDKAWKAFERRVAQRTGGERIPVADRRTPLDVAHPYLGIECKYRRKISKFLKEAMEQAIEGSGNKIPTVILGEKGSQKMLALMRLEDVLNLLAAAVREPDPLIVVGQNGEQHE